MLWFMTVSKEKSLYGYCLVQAVQIVLSFRRGGLFVHASCDAAVITIKYNRRPFILEGMRVCYQVPYVAIGKSR